MRKILFTFTLFSLLSNIAFAQSSCTCKQSVGLYGLPESYEVVETTIQLEDGAAEASAYEVDTVTAYQCLMKFKSKDIRKVFKLVSIDCQ